MIEEWADARYLNWTLILESLPNVWTDACVREYNNGNNNGINFPDGVCVRWCLLEKKGSYGGLNEDFGWMGEEAPMGMVIYD